MKQIDPAPRISGFIDRETELIGDIKFKENFRIDGVFKGKILSGNGLIIGETAEIEADIDVCSLTINGRVKGTIKAKDRIEIFSKGRVIGTVTTPKLIIEEGAFFQGSCQMEMKALESKNRGVDEKIVK
ncbi:polymer-forming cytoskeletal protein [candidate division KSB1 bacterium]|nr:polymer-forming cytoskeletal protein [Candidatus Aminicenantes bacterium]RQW03671.1 MAG: polymer-forming cytoskeletal protein [candidate division KSB1 bacterium]